MPPASGTLQFTSNSTSSCSSQHPRALEGGGWEGSSGHRQSWAGQACAVCFTQATVLQYPPPPSLSLCLAPMQQVPGVGVERHSPGNSRGLPGSRPAHLHVHGTAATVTTARYCYAHDNIDVVVKTPVCSTPGSPGQAQLTGEGLTSSELGSMKLVASPPTRGEHCKEAPEPDT